jgi:hypothetical protein
MSITIRGRSSNLERERVASAALMVRSQELILLSSIQPTAKLDFMLYGLIAAFPAAHLPATKPATAIPELTNTAAIASYG